MTTTIITFQAAGDFLKVKKKRAFFLDRDGVLNEEVNYLHRPEDLIMIDGTLPAIHEIHKNGYLAIVVTNQSGVARKMYGVEDIQAVHECMQAYLAKGKEKIDAFYFCPHHEKFSEPCSCRKPLPGMLEQAAANFNIDLSNSFMVGDRISDLNAGEAAGVKRSILVSTGYGTETLKKPEALGFDVYDNLLSAVQATMERERGGFWDRFLFPKLSWKFLLRLCALILFCLVLFRYILLPCIISGESMLPTYPGAGIAFCWTPKYWFSAPQLNDVVVLKYQKKIFYLKRIVGLPGDTIEIRDGYLYRNGQKIDEPYVKYRSTRWNLPPRQVEADHYYLLGDNRSMNINDHVFGQMAAKRILGVPLW